MQPFVDHHALAGAVTLVADKGKILSLEAVGFADLAAKKPMTTDALFWIASQSKPITATALMMLVDEGKVNVDDPVEKYLPEFKGQMLKVEAAKGQPDKGPPQLVSPKHPITVRNILSHTSGLPFKTDAEQPTLDLLPLKDAVLSYAKTPLIFEPDTKYQYSNAGINTAGRIIEVVSGMPYEKFLDERLFGPLGMKDTTFWPSEQQVARLAKSYKPNKDKTDLEEVPVGQLKYPLSDHSSRYPMPAGGLFSTASDVARFCQMILNGGEFEGRRYLSKAAIEQMTSKQTGELKQPYGFGWQAGNSIGHGGAHATNMSIDLRSGLITVYMIQAAGGFPKDGKEAQGAFKRAADEQFGPKK
jgi:CubicO group peptidase (beta-lactamase class C family)